MLYRMCFFFFKQKTAYEMRISDWSSDVCSSYLVGWEALLNRRSTTLRELPETAKAGLDAAGAARLMECYPTLIKRPVIEAGDALIVEIGRASCRERVCQ